MRSKLGLAALAAMVLAATPSGAGPAKKPGGPPSDKTKKHLDYDNSVQPTKVPPLICPLTLPPAPLENWPLSELVGTTVDPHDFDKAVNLHAFAGEALAAAKLPSASEGKCADLPEFDWVTRGKVTPIRDQRPCGSCWDFAAIGAYETSYAIRNNQLINASEQYSLDCATVPANDKVAAGQQAGSCGGSTKGPYHGGPHAIFNWMLTNGEDTEKQDPYQGKDLMCKPNAKAPYRTLAYDFVRSTPGIASVADIKKAICQHGGVVSSVQASNWGKYKCGVWKEKGVSGFDHSVQIVGWNNAAKAWLVKNTWSRSFGEDGFIWVAWDADNIGSAASWVEAMPKLNMVELAQIVALMKKHGLFPAPPLK